jgi:DNA-binding transcriptional ArsR family regulator
MEQRHHDDQTTQTDGGLTSNDIRAQFGTILERADGAGDRATPLEVLLTPRARVDALQAVLTASEPLTVAEVVEATGRNQSTVNRHLRELADLGYLEQSKKGNAAVFAPRADHPVIQLLEMLLTVQRHGVTPMHLDEAFIGTPGEDYDAGDHPANPGDWSA